MHLDMLAAFTWPDAAALIGLLVAATVLILGALATFVALRGTKVAAARQEDLRQLVRRYEHFAETRSTRSSGSWPTSRSCERGPRRSSRSCARSSDLGRATR